MENVRRLVVPVVSYLYILLFVYAAVSKILDFGNFRAQLGQSPLLSAFAGVVSYGVPAAELAIALLLSIPWSRRIGLYAAAVLMAMFSAYIIIILNFSSFVPCSCGGVLEKMGWTTHLAFNLVFVLLGMLGVALQASDWRKSIATVAAGAMLGAAAVTVAFMLSEDIMAKENPFIRRFPQGTAAKTNSVDIKYYSAYVAGVANGRIYLANKKAPLEILEYGTDLKLRGRHTIVLDRENFNFQAVQVSVAFPYFYLYDGNVPVVYKGLVAEWKARVVSDRKFSFIEIAFTESGAAIFRGRAPGSGENILAVTDTPLSKINYNPKLLERQFDGVFDTDGMLQYSQPEHKWTYTYFYRNQYLVGNEQLALASRNRTIDTTTTANIKTVKLPSGDTKIATPPYTVNKRTAVYGNLLFVNSMLRGRFESPEVWKSATAVDVYDINRNIYLLSFYVYDEDDGKMSDFFATDSALYVISGHRLLKYGYGQRILSKIEKYTGR
jgi:hypothetical protein